MEQNKNFPVPTGNPWQLSKDNPATVPVPLPIIIVSVEGPYTERDRKLWTFLLHAVWDEIPDEEPSDGDIRKLVVHQLSVQKINQVFRSLGGDHNSSWIWESAKRLAKTTVEWEDEEYNGIESLFGATVTKNARNSGILHFYFPPLLAPRLKKAKRYARLRVHFMVGLSGKYAVTLYDLLESVANKDNPVLETSVSTLRQWLKVPPGKLKTWDNLNRRALQPALKQINDNPLGAGFTVEMVPIKEGRTIDRVRFTIRKVIARLEFERKLLEGEEDISDNFGSLGNFFLQPETYEKAKAVAPGWDVYTLEREWREWMLDKEPPKNPNAAFIGFCRSWYKKRPRP